MGLAARQGHDEVVAGDVAGGRGVKARLSEQLLPVETGVSAVDGEQTIAVEDDRIRSSAAAGRGVRAAAPLVVVGVEGVELTRVVLEIAGDAGPGVGRGQRDLDRLGGIHSGRHGRSRVVGHRSGLARIASVVEVEGLGDGRTANLAPVPRDVWGGGERLGQAVAVGLVGERGRQHLERARADLLVGAVGDSPGGTRGPDRHRGRRIVEQSRLGGLEAKRVDVVGSGRAVAEQAKAGHGVVIIRAAESGVGGYARPDVQACHLPAGTQGQPARGVASESHFYHRRVCQREIGPERVDDPPACPCGAVLDQEADSHPPCGLHREAGQGVLIEIEVDRACRGAGGIGRIEGVAMAAVGRGGRRDSRQPRSGRDPAGYDILIEDRDARPIDLDRGVADQLAVGVGAHEVAVACRIPVDVVGRAAARREGLVEVGAPTAGPQDQVAGGSGRLRAVVVVGEVQRTAEIGESEAAGTGDGEVAGDEIDACAAAVRQRNRLWITSGPGPGRHRHGEVVAGYHRLARPADVRGAEVVLGLSQIQRWIGPVGGVDLRAVDDMD